MKYLTLTLLLLIGFLVFSVNYKDNADFKNLRIGSTILNVVIADTDTERIQGLSGKESLKEGEGMLFVFETEGFQGIWMKDMNFAIDIAWLDKNKRIIHLEENVSPSTYPKVFGPKNPSLFVLETNAGFLAKNNIKIGDLVAF